MFLLLILTPTIKPMKFLYLTLCIGFSISLSASAQKVFTFNQGHMASNQFYQAIPFEYIMHKIVIEAEVNGHTGRYILDTGAMCIIFKDSTIKQDYKVLRQMNINDANDKKRKTDVVQLNHIRIGELDYYDIPALYIKPFEGVLNCFNVDGLIGSNLLRFGALKIDMVNQLLLLADSFQDFDLERKEGIRLHCNKVQSSPFISLRMNGVKQKKVLVDTGSGGVYAFGEKVCFRMQHKGLFDQPAYVSSGTNSHGAWGTDSIDVKTNIWKVDELTFAGATFNNLLLRSDMTSSRIGMKLLENGEIIMDYPQKRFFFKAYDQKCDSVSVAGFGVDFASINDTLRVNGIWFGSEAEQKGIARGDILLDVVGFNLRETTLCEQFFQLKSQSEDKDELVFVLRRRSNGEEYQVELKRIKYE